MTETTKTKDWRHNHGTSAPVSAGTTAWVEIPVQSHLETQKTRKICKLQVVWKVVNLHIYLHGKRQAAHELQPPLQGRIGV